MQKLNNLRLTIIYEVIKKGVVVNNKRVYSINLATEADVDEIKALNDLPENDDMSTLIGTESKMAT